MSVFQRKPASQFPRSVIRIYTEGKKTEPNYFNAIKDELKRNEIEIIVDGRGDHTLSLVEWVINKKENERNDPAFVTEWWVVFDKDEHLDFNHAIELAEKNKIQVAYSNECFELWFILHFEYLQTAINRKAFNTKLTKLLSRKYEKNSNIYSIIKEKEAFAIKNAKKLEEMHLSENRVNQALRNPSTTVYKLVERMRKI